MNIGSISLVEPPRAGPVQVAVMATRVLVRRAPIVKAAGAEVGGSHHSPDNRT
jgi:hypothetical protein